MNNTNSTHNSPYNAAAGCDHCQGVTEHEPWCVTRDPRVCYAYEIVAQASKLTFLDTLILHSLGVTWADARV
jgi:hypothetical protein